MIPKTIHFCWFGRGEKPDLTKKCFKSWKKYAAGYEIIEWNEDNFDISTAPLYVQQAYETKKWAFVTDYVRLKVVHDHGGIYLDTDVELKKNLDDFLDYTAYFGFEDGKYINTGLGFGAVKGAQILKDLMADYSGVPFVMDNGLFDTTPCPVRNTKVFLGYGLRQDNSLQKLQENVLILPTSYLCPYNYDMDLTSPLKQAYSIHWFSASWHTPEQRKQHQASIKAARRERLRYAPNRFLLKVLGKERYETLKRFVK